MIYPSVDSLIKNVDSKYTLVIFAAKGQDNWLRKVTRNRKLKAEACIYSIARDKSR